MKASPPPRLVVIDLDGTLLRSDGAFSPVDLEALREAGRRGVIRALATGRSLFSIQRALDQALEGRRLPVDYVIFSTGVGVMRESDGLVLRSSVLTTAETARAGWILLEAEVDFMVQEPVPENHRFAYHDTGRGNPDFLRRVDLYEGYCRPLPDPLEEFGPATQLIAVLLPKQTGIELVRKLTGYSVIRATSPLDGASTWIEILPPGVSKSAAAAWLAKRLDVDPDRTLAVGTDVNDLDLLEWAGEARVVANGHPEVLPHFPQVASHDDGGVAEALKDWL